MKASKVIGAKDIAVSLARNTAGKGFLTTRLNLMKTGKDDAGVFTRLGYLTAMSLPPFLPILFCLSIGLKMGLQSSARHDHLV